MRLRTRQLEVETAPQRRRAMDGQFNLSKRRGRRSAGMRGAVNLPEDELHGAQARGSSQHMDELAPSAGKLVMALPRPIGTVPGKNTTSSLAMNGPWT
mmetsp:Transcript_19516/g.55909  ORF Transcript_19516/g.55909 Transcript_19516/m.55909 type:complete len:98 (+) Transcript_19516:30-323(+)